MATAAPAAPSTSAPTAQPSPGPAIDGPEATPVAAPDNQPRLAKPIRPIPSLPGVFPDDDPFPPPPSRSAASSDPATPGATAPPTRGPDGRFLAGTSPAGTDFGEHAPQPGDAKPQPSKFKFAGEDYDSQEAAEQNVRSLRGQFRPVQSLARSLGGVDKIVPRFSEAAESARGWKAEADRLSAELAAYESGDQPIRAAKTPTGPDAMAASVADVDWDLYAEIKKLASDSGEPWKAEQWLIEETRKVERARYESLLDERLAPMAEKEAHQAVIAQTETLFGSLAEYTHSDGSPAFPELHDPTASRDIGRMWASLGLPPEHALTPQGAIAAIGIYRMSKGNQRSQAGPAPTVPAPAPRPFVPTDAHAAATLEDGRAQSLSMPGGTSPSAEAARILAGLRSVNQGNRSLLGFDA